MLPPARSWVWPRQPLQPQAHWLACKVKQAGRGGSLPHTGSGSIIFLTLLLIFSGVHSICSRIRHSNFCVPSTCYFRCLHAYEDNQLPKGAVPDSASKQAVIHLPVNIADSFPSATLTEGGASGDEPPHSGKQPINELSISPLTN